MAKRGSNKKRSIKRINTRVNCYGLSCKITISKHAVLRMEQRDIGENTVIDNITAINKDSFIELYNNQEEAVIVNDIDEVSVIIKFKENRIYVITVIDTNNTYNNYGTKIVNV